jgi:hypothetical protein
VTTATAAKKTSAATSNKAIQPAAKPSVVVVDSHGTPSRPASGKVYVRHMRKPRNAFILIKDTAVFSTASNWATAEEFKTPEAAIAWAKKNRLTVAS